MSENNSFDPTSFAKENVDDPEKNMADMQNKMAEAQQKLNSIKVEGQAGLDNYTVTISMNGRHEADKVTIAPQLLEKPDVLCDLIASAITDASRKAEKAIQAEMMSIFQG